jgi:GNAT superfamily N-acetyltransferase
MYFIVQFNWENMRQSFNVILCPLLVVATMMSNLRASSDDYTVKVHSGHEWQSFMPFVVEQRISFFRDYPYLYEGNVDEENTYIGWFSKLPHSAIAVVYADKKPVGFITGTALKDFEEHFKGAVEVFKYAGLEPATYYYIAEVIVLPSHRGKNLASTRLFAAIEQYAQGLGYRDVCFVTESHDVHPLKPQNYRSLDPLWQKVGYTKSSLFLTFPWLTIQLEGSPKQQEHKLDFWLKSFCDKKDEL